MANTWHAEDFNLEFRWLICMKAMSRRSGVLFPLVLIILGSPYLALSQCINQITLVPLRTMKAASRARDFSRFSYSLSASDSLLIRSHENSGTSIGPYDTGFVITHNAKPIRDVTLRGLSELRNEETWYSESFTTLAVTRACRGADPIYFITMQYMGDRTSPALIFTIIPSQQGYKVSTVPLISGGVLDVSVSNPLHLRTWDNLHEGMCEACGTAYEITEFEIRNGKPIRTRQYRTRHQYTSSQFDDLRRIRFVP
jgi:hypothetical protein